VGYAGRILDDSLITPENPKYLFPETRERNGVIHRFDPGEILYNAHRVGACSERLMVAGEIEDVWRVRQKMMGRVVGLLGIECGLTQAGEILRLAEKTFHLDYLSANPPSEWFWQTVGRIYPIRWDKDWA